MEQGIVLFANFKGFEPSRDGGWVEIWLDAFGGESIGSEAVRRSRPENLTIHTIREYCLYSMSLEKVRSHLVAVESF